MNKYGKRMFAMVDANQNIGSPRKHCKALPTVKYTSAAWEKRNIRVSKFTLTNSTFDYR